MKWAVRCLTILVCLSLLVGCQKKSSVFYNAKGNLWRASDFSGKWLVVNYWAGWCHTCQKEVPDLNAFFNAHPKNVALVGVNFDNATGSQLKSMASELGIEYPLLQHFSPEKYDLGVVEALPATFVINPKGVCMKTLYGPNAIVTLNKMFLKHHGA
jgi:thiol-disulfide isomerase/thioredoxin